MLKKSFDLIKDAEIKSSGHEEESLPIDRVHQSVNLSLKLLWCTCTMMMQKEK